MSKNEIIKIKNLTVQFGDFVAVDNISANIPQGRLTGLIGPSGAGKTTLIRSIVGRQKISSGQINIKGLQAGSAELRNDVSYKTQEVSMYGDLTVRQNLKYFSTMMNVPKDLLDSQVENLIKVMDLEAQTNQLASSLSGGQKQRVSLAIALIGNPEILILDEPTVGLDPVLRDDLWKLFKKLVKDGATLLISSHVMDEAERCDDLILVRDGKIVVHDTPNEIRKQTKSETIEQSFLKLARGGK